MIRAEVIYRRLGKFDEYLTILRTCNLEPATLDLQPLVRPC